MILITGGAGFIGSSLVDRLLASGRNVSAIDNYDPFYPQEIKKRNLRQAMNSTRFSFVEGDIRDAKFLDATFSAKRPNTVIHLAARAGVRPSIQDPVGYADVNVIGTACVLDACRRHGVRRVLFGSSSSVYGECKRVPFSEEVRVDHPVSPYAATKKAGEELAYTYHHLYSLQIICLRFFTVYGPRQRPEMAIHKFTDLIHKGKELPIYGEGDTQRDYTYIADIVEGLMAAIDKPLPGWAVYNLGEAETTRLKDLIALLETALGKRAVVKYFPSQPGDVSITYADLTRARRDLGYAPTVPIAKGVPLFVQWYLNQEVHDSEKQA